MVLIFINFFIWFKEGHLNFSKKRGSSSQIFLWQIFHEFFPILIFGLEDFSSCVGSTQIILEGFYNSFLLKRIPINYEFYSSPFKNYSLAMTYVENFLPKPTSPLWVKSSIKSSKVQLPLDFNSIYFKLKIFFCHLFGP